MYRFSLARKAYFTDYGIAENKTGLSTTVYSFSCADTTRWSFAGETYAQAHDPSHNTE